MDHLRVLGKSRCWLTHQCIRWWIWEITVDLRITVVYGTILEINLTIGKFQTPYYPFSIGMSWSSVTVLPWRDSLNDHPQVATLQERYF